MIHRYNFEAVDRTLRDITRFNLPFGGKAVLLIGDFHQILPVVRIENRSETVEAYFKRSLLYPFSNTLRLEENMRLLALRRDGTVDPVVLQFPSFLLQVGEGKLQETSSEPIVLPTTIQMAKDIEGLIEAVFPDLENNYCDDLWLSQRAILTTRNMMLEMLNDCADALIPGENRIYKSADAIDNPKKREIQYPAELLNSIPGTASLLDHRQCLKKATL